MDIVERFIDYCKVETMSDPYSNSVPSSQKQWNLARKLEKELTELGLDVKLSDSCIVYGRLKSNTDKKVDTIGLIAHMDTSPDMSDINVKPRIIEKYDGSEIVLNEKLNIKMSPKEFPCLKKDVGADLIVTDGTTLLGGDDKAGIAVIMDLLEKLVNNPDVKHGDIAIAFTPDEEVGRGTENFDVEYFNADYAYTVDGGDVCDIEYENFNAASAIVKIAGLSIHPGSAKGKMLNSILIGMEFQSLLPTFDNPMYTEGYEGFNHLGSINGDCESTTLEYIIRNHDKELLEKQKNDFVNAVDFLNKKYGEGTVSLDIKDSYQNMKEFIVKRMDIVDNVKNKMKALGVEPTSSAIRGGTDGASLTYKGLPCPNLGNGDRNCHGKFEYVNINEMKFMSKLLVEVVRV